MARILVLYGTTERHTEKIAAVIGRSLTALGLDVSVIEAGTRDPLPSFYDGVIIAASLHAGKYQKTVADWVRSHLAELNAKPAAFVTVCLAAASKRPGAAAEVEAISRSFVDRLGWRPAVTKAVAGALLYRQYNIFIRWFMRRIAAKEGGDTDTSRDYEYTDWGELRQFSQKFGLRILTAAA